ncbi:MAG TPA: 3-dehydroquinate synthase [Ferruginibacter sp.]|nr:3-dehydroquinate synthase [Ferruginibacter sp.]HRE63702.1 3-dehydroquinate synthase [Ferruginibacter sp.]
MKEQPVKFSSKTVHYFFDVDFSILTEHYPKEKLLLITDENVYGFHRQRLNGIKSIVIKPGEARKQQATVDAIILQLLEMQADKQTVIVGLGGGVVTDIAGYVASIYKRGVRLVQVPTSILAMVDAAVGGKNGIDVGEYKNQVGTIYQPDLLLFDYSFLSTLPREEWINGFAEIIKHACIKDDSQFEFLAHHTIDDFINDKNLLASFIEKNVGIKLNVVLNDEMETGERKLLNFGHTLGHAIEACYNLPHGHAISIGMVAAATLSNELASLSLPEKDAIKQLLRKYGLPVHFAFDTDKIWDILANDKKRENNHMSFILLNKIGEGVVQSIPLNQLKKLIHQRLLD